MPIYPIAANVQVSATALPLPDGASTEATLSAVNAKLPALVAGKIPVSGTVALDSASLDALENISVTFPATQNVNVSNIPATQPVSLATAPTTPVTGTFWQATQPVSANALPLPTGASSETTLSAVNTKIPSNLTVSSTRLLVDGSGVTQPVSGTVTANTGLTQPLTDAQLRLTAVPVSGTFWQATQPVSIASAPVTPVTDNGGSLTVDGTITTTPQQGTTVGSTTFISTTPSSSVIAASGTRKGLTIYNAGFGDLYICAGATCTTTSFQLKLVSGDYWECPPAQVTLAHAGVYATAGTAYVTTIT